MSNVNILFFDYWTTGIHNILPLSRLIYQRELSFQMLHLGSWRDPAIPQSEVLDGIHCEDISLYGGSVAQALFTLRPSVVVMLNTALTMDRTVNRVCRRLGIKTIYLTHGITAIDSDLDAFVEHQNSHWTWAKRFGKVGKYAKICMGYLEAIAQHRPIELLSPKTYGHFIQMALWPGAAHQQPWPHEDIYCDLALVYANVYRDSLLKETGYPLERVIVVGNPNLDAAYALKSDAQASVRADALIRTLGVTPGRQAVVYMEDCFPEQGIGGWTEQTRTAELLQVAQAVHAAGFDLIIKMHPGSQFSATLREFENDPHTHVVLKIDLSELIFGCAATIGHISTTLMLPIVLGRPLIVPTWSPGLDRFGYYVAAGAATPAASPTQLTELLLNLEVEVSSNNPRLQRFISEYVTHTDGRSLERIVDEIAACAKNLPAVRSLVAS
jgi:hypothetical protein